MVDTETKDLLAQLERAVKKIQDERDEDRAAFEERQADFLHREEMVRQAIAGLSNGTVTPRKKETTLSISDELYNKVVAYVKKHPQVRQIDIQKKAAPKGLNSGTVSVALRKLRDEGMIKMEGRVDGSNFWVTTEKFGGDRETVVTPGEGVRKGRRSGKSSKQPA